MPPDALQKIRCDYLLISALDDEAAALGNALQGVKAKGPKRLQLRDVPTVQEWGLPRPICPA